MKASKLQAIVIQDADKSYFAFIKQFPAAAVSADNLNDLDSKLKTALRDVIDYENINYNIENIRESA